MCEICVIPGRKEETKEGCRTPECRNGVEGVEVHKGWKNLEVWCEMKPEEKNYGLPSSLPLGNVEEGET